MKTYIFLFLMILGYLINGCSCSTIDAGEEGVMIYQPWFFGHGGVDPQPIKAGLEYTALSTVVERYDIKPLQFTETFDDLITKDNNPVDFSSYLELQIETGKTPQLHELFGREWYERKIKEKYRTIIRDLGRENTMFELTTDPNLVAVLEKRTFEETSQYITEQKIPVILNRVTIGKVSPPDAVIEETIKTAAQNQRDKTENARAKAELSRKQAEINKAIADRAYRENFGMSTLEYLRLRELEIEKEKLEIVRGKDNVSIILNSGAIPMFNSIK